MRGDNASSNAEIDSSVSVPGCEAGLVESSQEPRLYLHRHWSLLEALGHSTLTYTRLALWQQPQGPGRLLELLARAGLPLQQSKQAYAYMAPALRAHFMEQIMQSALQQQYGLQGLFFPSFQRTLVVSAFKSSAVSASDLVLAACSLLEAEPAGREAFFEAYEALGGSSKRGEELMKKGIQVALGLQRSILKKASGLLEGRGLQRLHRLHFAYLKHTSTDLKVPMHC